MQKIFTPGTWAFDDTECAAIPTLRSGDIGAGDRRVFAKRAGEELMAKLAGVKFGPGEQPIHLIAIGSTEWYSSNRNGDGFREPVCREYHDTFVKHAKFFRDHQTKDRQKSYGVVKLSHYNEKMHRIELVAALNETKQAADKNGGRIADLELQKLADQRDIPVSMGCFLPFDSCSHCHHKSRNRSEYCDEGMCKAGGLKHNMGRLQADGSVLHADNPNPTFNDISHITRSRQADRTAFVLGALQKSAAAGIVISGAELAELVYGAEPTTRWSKFAAELADLDSQATPRSELLLALSGRSHLPPIPLRDVTKLAMVTTALANQQVVLPIDEFVTLLAGRDLNMSQQLKQATVGLFDRLETADYNPYEYSGPVSAACATWAAQAVPEFGLSPQAISKRAALRSLQNVTQPVLSGMTKAAAVNDVTEALAQQYGLYVLTSLNKMRDKVVNFPLTATACMLQNRVH